MALYSTFQEGIEFYSGEGAPEFIRTALAAETEKVDYSNQQSVIEALLKDHQQKWEQHIHSELLIRGVHDVLYRTKKNVRDWQEFGWKLNGDQYCFLCKE